MPVRLRVMLEVEEVEPLQDAVAPLTSSVVVVVVDRQSIAVDALYAHNRDSSFDKSIQNIAALS